MKAAMRECVNEQGDRDEYRGVGSSIRRAAFSDVGRAMCCLPLFGDQIGWFAGKNTQRRDSCPTLGLPLLLFTMVRAHCLAHLWLNRRTDYCFLASSEIERWENARPH